MSKKVYEWGYDSPAVSEPEVTPVEDNFWTTPDDDGGFLSGVSNWWKRVTGSGTTTAAKEANDFNAEQSQINRDWQSAEAQNNRNFQAQQAEQAYQRQVDFYEQYQSPAAMVRQYQEAGLNPALMVGGSVGQTSIPSSASPSGSSVGSSQASASMDTGDMGSVLQFVMSLLKVKSELNVADSVANKNNAEASKVTKETSWIDTYNTTKVDEMRAGINQVKSNIELNSAKVGESLQSVQESLKRMEKMSSEINVNGALVDLHGSQQVLNETRTAMERMNIKHMEKLLPYVEMRQEAEIALANAKTEEARMSAENHMYDANLKMLKSLVDAKLIDSSYYDSVIDQAYWDAKYKKREYKWKPVNDICHNVSMLCMGAGSLM